MNGKVSTPFNIDELCKTNLNKIFYVKHSLTYIIVINICIYINIIIVIIIHNLYLYLYLYSHLI
jgi:hypothetical protein